MREYIPKQNPFAPIRNRVEDRDRINKQVEEFLKRGGKIQQAVIRNSAEVIRAIKAGTVEYKNRPI